jgi:hypothetical protein
MIVPPCYRIVGLPVSELDLGFVLIKLVDEEAVELGCQEREQHDAEKHEGRVVDFKHV